MLQSCEDHTGMTEVLKERARKGRLWSVIATSAAKSGHPGGALSMDIYMTLLASANVTPDNSDCMERDRIVISHGHTSAGYYSALAAYGFFCRKRCIRISGVPAALFRAM